jgi:hypothetical protein
MIQADPAEYETLSRECLIKLLCIRDETLWAQELNIETLQDLLDLYRPPKKEAKVVKMNF